MGSSHSQISESEFNKTWRVADTIDHLTIWENKDNPAYQLEQYYVQDLEDSRTRQLYTLRKHNPYLVGAYTLSQDGFGCCTDRQGTKVFIERIPLRLSNIEDIPFPDIIHLLDACLQGFGQLSNVVGFFGVDEEQVGVNERGQVKVWLNTAFENTQATGLRDVPQYEMLQDILTLVYQSEDRESYPPNVPPLSDAIGMPDKTATFESVTGQFKDYAKKYTQSFIPLSLQCIHSVGGAHLINDWCRNNRSYGFEQNSLRISEKAYQSKIGKVQNSGLFAAAPEVRESVQSNPIDSQLANALGSRVNAQQPLFSINSQVQQQQQLERGDLAQLHHRFIQPQITSQVIPQQQRIVQIIPQQPLPPQPLQQAQQQQVLSSQSIPQQVFISQAVPQKPQQPQQQVPPQQAFISQTVPPQPIPQQQVFISSQPLPQQQIYQQIPQQQQQAFIPREQIVYKPQNQVIFSQQSNVSSHPQPQYQSQQQYQQFQRQQSNFDRPIYANETTSNVIPVPPQKSQSTVQYLEKQPSKKEIISEVFPQNQSRLQQQRVISQTIEIKDNSKVNETNIFLTNTSPSYNYDDVIPKRSSEGLQAPDDNLHTYARAVPFSVNVQEDKFTPSDDGKSSADFLALLSQLKNGARGDYEVYSQVADTPSYAKANPSEESPKQYFNYLPQETYSQQATSNYQDSHRNIEESYGRSSPEWKYGGEYNFSKYEGSIDPDLQADLAQYKS